MVLGPYGLVGLLVLLLVVVVVRRGQGLVLIPHHSMVVLTVPVLDGNNKLVTLKPVSVSQINVSKLDIYIFISFSFC